MVQEFKYKSEKGSKERRKKKEKEANLKDVRFLY